MSDLTTQRSPIKSNCYCLPRLILGHCSIMLPRPRTLLSARFLQPPHPPPLPPSCLNLLLSALSNTEQAEKPPVQEQLTRPVALGEGCPWLFVVGLRVWSYLQVERNLISGPATSAQWGRVASKKKIFKVQHKMKDRLSCRNTSDCEFPVSSQLLLSYTQVRVVSGGWFRLISLF